MPSATVPSVVQATPEFEFTEKGKQLASSLATVTLYRVLLGRDPENSFVIEEAKTQAIGALFRTFLRSQEFKDFVILPLKAQARLRHEFTAKSPAPEQLEWLVSLVVLPPEQAAAIRAAGSWREFFHELLAATPPDASRDAPSDALRDALHGAPRDALRDALRDTPHDPTAAVAAQSHEGGGALPAPSPGDWSTPSAIAAAALEEIACIEGRLERLKALIRPLAEPGADSGR